MRSHSLRRQSFKQWFSTGNRPALYSVLAVVFIAAILAMLNAAGVVSLNGSGNSGGGSLASIKPVSSVGMVIDGKESVNLISKGGEVTVSIDAGSVSTPTVTITTDVETFACLSCGRWQPSEALDSGRITVAGDTALGQTIINQMNIMI